MSFVAAIAAKRDGHTLSRDQVRAFVAGATSGELPAEQLAAMLMAICCRGMSVDETHWLTEAMLRSGETWDLADANPAVVDKHSTGGVGDTVSLVLAPLLAALGVPVAMMAGRGLGHSQGTLDKLEALPGFMVHRDRQGTLDLVEACGAALVAQTATVAPADRVLYALRDVTGTVPSLPLIVSSIMSKKLALGAPFLILDVKWGRGAFRKTVPEAVELAAALRSVARAAGCVCEALITDMNEPLGPALGTTCEVAAAEAVLAGGGDSRLREVSLVLSAEAMVLTGADRNASRARLEGALADGSALAAWHELVRAHGGDPDPERRARPHEVFEVEATHRGVVSAIDGEALGWLAVDVGAGRRRRDEPLAHGAGLEVAVRIGDPVEPGQPLVRVLVGDRPVDRDEVRRRALATVEIGEAASPSPLVMGTVDDLSGETA